MNNNEIAHDLRGLKATVKLMLHPTSRMAQDACVDLHRDGTLTKRDLEILQEAIEALDND
jgi:hypothetical protein